jgi:hypothetical protein
MHATVTGRHIFGKTDRSVCVANSTGKFVRKSALSWCFAWSFTSKFTGHNVNALQSVSEHSIVCSVR